MAGLKGNIFVTNGVRGVYLFTAKDGPSLPLIVKKALIRGKSRWGDTPYLTRIIFSELVQKEPMGLLANTGYGISPTLMDNENYIIALNDSTQKVGFFTEDGHNQLIYDYAQYVTAGHSFEWNRIGLNDYYRMYVPHDAKQFENIPYKW